jgi:5-methylcytosine-specific restriction protein A
MNRQTICKYPACRRTVDKNEGYCKEHKWSKTEKEQRKKQYNGYKYTYSTSYQNRKWRAFRLRYLKYYPYCTICGEKSEVIDHIIPHRGDEQLFWNERNYMPLCKKCHDTKTGLFDTHETTKQPTIEQIIQQVRLYRGL